MRKHMQFQNCFETVSKLFFFSFISLCGQFDKSDGITHDQLLCLSLRRRKLNMYYQVIQPAWLFSRSRSFKVLLNFGVAFCIICYRRRRYAYVAV